MKKFVGIILVTCIVLSVFGVNVFADESEVKVFVDGEELIFDVSPIVENGRTLVPIRAISEYLKYEVSWDNEKWEAEIKNDGNTMVIGVDKTEYTKNGEVKEMDVPAKLVNGRTLVPLRLIAENFGCTVEWDDDANSAYIETKTEEITDSVKETVDEEDEWTPNFNDYSNGSINNPYSANIMYNYNVETGGKKKAKSNLVEYIEYQPSSQEDVKKIIINSVKTLEGDEAYTFMKKLLDDDKDEMTEAIDNQTWWIHKISIRYFEGTGNLNISELINENNLFVRNGEQYETIESFIIYNKKIYHSGDLLEFEIDKDAKSVYLCTLINKTDDNPILKIPYGSGEMEKFIHLNSYIKKSEEEQEGTELILPTKNPHKVDGDLANQSNVDIDYYRSQMRMCEREMNYWQNYFNSLMSQTHRIPGKGKIPTSEAQEAYDNYREWAHLYSNWKDLIESLD